MIQLISLLGGIATTWFEGKVEEQKAKHEVKIKTIKAQESWDNIQAQGSSSSLKDEWFVAVLSIPLVGAFIPSMVPYIERGFAVLQGMPDFYKAFLGAAIAAAFGIKSLSTVWKK